MGLSQATKNKAARVAQRVAGLKKVVNDLQVQLK
jgi:osmotically-inducible protein OsmY